MQTICTSLQTDNHTNTTSLNFYRPDALHDAQRTVSKHWRTSAEGQILYFSVLLKSDREILTMISAWRRRCRLVARLGCGRSEAVTWSVVLLANHARRRAQVLGGEAVRVAATAAPRERQTLAHRRVVVPARHPAAARSHFRRQFTATGVCSHRNQNHYQLSLSDPRCRQSMTITVINYNLHKRRHSRWKLSQELKGK